MSQARAKRTSLLIGCGSAALALGLALGPAPASAQAIQATGNVSSGNASINQTVNGQTTVSVTTPSTVIDWTPLEDASGNALDFLPANTTAFFENNSSASFVSNFAVLNRILPSTNGNVAVINGNVISQIIQFNGSSSIGGFVAFYSPTGILVGSTASFDVGQLLLTTLDVSSNGDFQNFVQSGFPLPLVGASGSTARIRINPGAQINATRDNAFFAVVAADVEMLGVARVNGSQAYVAGEAVNLTFNNGLFNIQIPVGTAAAGEVVTLDGTIGGPASQGLGDNHVIYAVARASQDPISMLFRGNLGFDPAQTAGVVNGEIILAANYNVFGRTVDGGTISSGANGSFNGNTALSNVRADIAITDATVTGSMLAIGTHAVTASATGADSSFSGNLLLVGRESARLSATGGNDIAIAGDLLVDASDFGVSNSGLQSLDVINAQGGTALVESNTGSTIAVSGAAVVTADAQAGAETLSRIAGSATGGNAAISADGGVINVGAGTQVSARGLGSSIFGALTGAESRGGSAEVRATGGGSVTLASGVNILAGATGAQGSDQSPSSLSNAYGGTARIAVREGGGTISVGGNAFLDARGFGGSSNGTGTGSVGDAGEATVSILNTGLITIASGLQLSADGIGGANGGGTGGTGLGGRATVFTQNGGTVNVTGAVSTTAQGTGGIGVNGGDGFGGIAGAQAKVGAIGIVGSFTANANGNGADAAYDFGGNGGNGRAGNAILQADGTLTQTAQISVADVSVLTASAGGGTGGAADGLSIAAGRGGNAYGGESSVPNQADAAFGSGVYALAGGDNGTLNLNGVFANADGFGGNGGNSAGGLAGGAGGDGFGGFAQIGLGLLIQSGSIGLGQANLGAVFANANGVGGRSGLDGSDLANGIGGNGTGGLAALTLGLGAVTADTVSFNADGTGGEGGTAGNGQGGQSTVQGTRGGTLESNEVTLVANGFGGRSEAGNGGTGLGGNAGIIGTDTTITIDGDVLVQALGFGGASDDGFGANGIGGSAYIATTSSTVGGTIAIAGHSVIAAYGIGGDSQTNFAAGDGFGGSVSAEANGGGSVTFGSLELTAYGRGGLAATHEGGNGTGGNVVLRASGFGSILTVLRNVPAAFNPIAPTSDAIIDVNGIGADTFGGDGVGGRGQGGSILLSARQGGTLNLPLNILSDPARAADRLIMLANGTGGASAADGGIGGAAVGGQFTIDVDGGTLASDAIRASLAAIGGSSDDTGLDIGGGSAIGGTMRLFVTGGGTASLANLDVDASAEGGDGSGGLDGGSAISGRTGVLVVGSTLNVTSGLGLYSSASGGSGAVGGDAFSPGEGANFFEAEDSLLNFGNVGEFTGVALESEVFGGNGIAQGGSARGSIVNISIRGTSFLNGGLSVFAGAYGGNADGATGIGGNAQASAINIFANPSVIGLAGRNVFDASARGGSAATGGNAIGGAITANLRDTEITVTGDAFSNGELRFVSQAVAGQGINDVNGVSMVGNATAGNISLRLNGSTILVDQLTLSAAAGAQSSDPEIAGGTATAGNTEVFLTGASRLDLGSLLQESTALSSLGIRQVQTGVDAQGNPIFTTLFDFSGETAGGNNRLAIGIDSPAVINAAQIDLNSENSGGGFNQSGQFSIELLSGEVNAGVLNARNAVFTASNSDGVSEVIARGAALRVQDARFSTSGDLNFITSENGIIGSAGGAGDTNSLFAEARGTLTLTGEGMDRGRLGGDSIFFSAGRSILLDGTITSANGDILLIANDFLTGFSPNPQPNVFTMSQGALIDAGTGLVRITVNDGGGNTQRANGAITLGTVSAGSIIVSQLGSSAGSDIIVLPTGVLTASGSGRAIDLASFNGEVINNHGDAGLILTGGGHYGIWAATPTGSVIGSLANYERFYNVQTELAYDAINTGSNFAAFRIAPVLTVLANPATRFYGSANPAFTASILGFLPGDSVANITGVAQFVTSANGTSPVGLYTLNVTQGTLASAQGYQFVFEPGVLNITPRPITITASDLSRIYGNANPALTYTVGGQGLVNGDQLAGALATAAGVTSGVGNYAITQGTLAASANYAVTFNAGTLAVTPRPITITASDFSRVYGDANPALTFSVGGQGLVNGDQLTGALATLAGVTSGVGQYAITQGSLTAGANYVVTYNAGVLSITPRPIIVTADSLSRFYGNANPDFTFTVTFDDPTGGGNNSTSAFASGAPGLVNGDQLSGALGTAASVTSGIGTYAITLGTLGGNGNYSITFNPGVLTITPRPITVTASDLSRVYGNANPALGFTVGGLGLVNGDQLTGALASMAGVTSGVGNYAITQGTLAAGGNYALTFNPGVLSITPRPITVTASDLSRIYGNANPALGFTVGGLGLVNGDQLTGALASMAGVTSGVGNYAITQGTLTAGGNYALTFNPGVLTITPRPLTVAANNQSKTLGFTDPLLTFLITGGDLVNGDQLTGSLVRAGGETIGTFAITQGTLTAGANYTLTFTPGTFTINPPPVSPDINNPITFEPPVVIDETMPPVMGEADGRFGIDFPEQPDAPLISEDPLLDDPVASGGDSSLYGDDEDDEDKNGASAPAGGE